MRRFCNDIKRYYRYILYSAKSILKQEVADSFLNWIWLILNPIMFMLVYAFVQIAIFSNGTAYLASFLFIGLTCWNFFNPCITGSIRMIKRYQGIISKVYVPKYVFLLSNMLVNGFKTSISFLLVILSLIAYRVPFSPKMLLCIPYLIMLFLVTFGISCILLHAGVFFDDLANIVPIAMRMLFFLSGIFYDLEGRLGGGLGFTMEYLNPVAHVILELRRILIFDRPAHLPWLFGWLAIGLILSIIGVALIYKYERRYVKTI